MFPQRDTVVPLNSWGYSPLNQVNRANVGQCANVGQFKNGLDARIGVGVQEATPLGHDGILFFLLPSNLVKAINGATGDLS